MLESLILLKLLKDLVASVFFTVFVKFLRTAILQSTYE